MGSSIGSAKRCRDQRRRNQRLPAAADTEEHGSAADLLPRPGRRTGIGRNEETATLESGVRTTRFRRRAYVRGPHLVLAEVLLALIAADQARAEVTRAAPAIPPSSPRELRQLDFRDLLVRSLSYSRSRLQSAAKDAAKDTAKPMAGKAALYPRGGLTDQRSLQALLLRPVVENPAGRFVNARAEMSGRFGIAPTGGAFSLKPATAIARSAAPTTAKTVATTQAVTAAVPVLRNPDVRPDRNLDTLAPAAAASPAAENYDQTGVTVGSFLYKPALEIWGGYNSNPGRQATAVGSPAVIVAPELTIRSQFERHQLNADLRFAYNETTAQQALSHPTADAKINGRYDLGDSTKLSAEGRFLDDALITAGFLQQPRATTLGTTVGIAQQVGSTEIAVKGSFDRILFSNALLGNNQVLNTQDRNYRQPGAQVRVTYALSPELSPFIDLSYDRREHDMTTDFNGMRRDSKGIAGRGGVALTIGSLSGDVSVGYLTRRFDAPNMQNVSGWIADATLAFAADPTTTFVLVARSQASETPAANIFGILSRDVILQVDHQFEPWLTGTLRSGYGRDQFVGTTRIDNRFFVAGGGVYKLSHTLHLKSEVRAEWTRSNMAMNDILAIVGLVGVRLQY